LSGTKPLTVTLKDFLPVTDNQYISWNSATDNLDIARDLLPGIHKVTIKVSNNQTIDELEVTITVVPRISGVTVAANGGATSVKKGKSQAFTATVSGTFTKTPK